MMEASSGLAGLVRNILPDLNPNLEGEHEQKFVFSNSVAPAMIEWLRSVCHPDPKFPEGEVSSIYYDSRDWRMLREKVNSDYLKTKVRLRWYANMRTGAPGEASFLEVKRRIGATRNKWRTKTAFSGKWLHETALEDGKLMEVNSILRANGIFMPDIILPSFRISYKRVRLIEPQTRARLAIDFDIQSPRVNTQLMPRSNPAKLNVAVFEVKGPLTGLPPILHEAVVFGCRRESFSKYLTCYTNIMGTVL